MILRRTPAEESQSVILGRSSGFRYWVGEVLVVAMWFGMAGGLLEGVTWWTLQRAGLLTAVQQFISVNANILWVSPLVNVLLFLMVAAVPLVLDFIQGRTY